MPDLAGYELDQPHNRIISLGVWAPFPSAVNVAGVRISNARQIADIAAKHRIPAIGYKEKEYVRTPQQDLAYARWAKCNAPFVQLEWVDLDGGIYTIGMEHSITSATASAWERTPWHAVQGAARDALRERSETQWRLRLLRLPLRIP